MTVALRELEVGPAYAAWTGIGAAGEATVGMAFLGDVVSAAKLVSIGLILAGSSGSTCPASLRYSVPSPAAQRRDERSSLMHTTASAAPKAIHGAGVADHGTSGTTEA
jgi:Small Multidrug Resistance protein